MVEPLLEKWICWQFGWISNIHNLNLIESVECIISTESIWIYWIYLWIVEIYFSGLKCLTAEWLPSVSCLDTMSAKVTTNRIIHWVSLQNSGVLHHRRNFSNIIGSTDCNHYIFLQWITWNINGPYWIMVFYIDGPYYDINHQINKDNLVFGIWYLCYRIIW